MAIKREACDDWFSKCVRARDTWCMHCGREDTLQAMHIVGRRNKAVRWSLDNAVTGCAACHRYFTENPLAFHVDLLREKSQAILKTNEALRKEIAKHYREEFRRWKADDSHEIISYN
jgi:5-methylcytosine-specific restriction endonuclease McrA